MEYIPATQEVQTAAPTAAEYWPAAQSLHADAALNEKRPAVHAAHAVCAVAPIVDENCPAAQAEQESEEMAATSEV